MPKVVLDAKTRGQLKLSRDSLMRKCNSIFTRYGVPVTLFIKDGSQIYIYQSQPDFPPVNPLGLISTPENYLEMPKPMRAISTLATQELADNKESLALAGFSMHANSISATKQPAVDKESLARAGFSLEEKEEEEEEDDNSSCYAMATGHNTDEGASSEGQDMEEGPSSDDIAPSDSFQTPMSSPRSNTKSSGIRKQRSPSKNSPSRVRLLSYSPSSSRNNSVKKRRKDRVMFRTLDS